MSERLINIKEMRCDLLDVQSGRKTMRQSVTYQGVAGKKDTGETHDGYPKGNHLLLFVRTHTGH